MPSIYLHITVVIFNVLIVDLSVVKSNSRAESRSGSSSKTSRERMHSGWHEKKEKGNSKTVKRRLSI
jgi:hypothetical protein